MFDDFESQNDWLALTIFRSQSEVTFEYIQDINRLFSYQAGLRQPTRNPLVSCRNPLGSYYDPTHVISDPTRIPRGSDSSIPDPSRIPHTPASIIILNKRWGRIPQARIPRAPAPPFVEYYKGGLSARPRLEWGRRRCFLHVRAHLP